MEEFPPARLYRQAPLNSIWEGSGNVICLDVLRAFHREPESLSALLQELEQGRGLAPGYDGLLDQILGWLQQPEALQQRARVLVESLGLALQASALRRSAPESLVQAFIQHRISRPQLTLGALHDPRSSASLPREAAGPPEAQSHQPTSSWIRTSPAPSCRLSSPSQTVPEASGLSLMSRTILRLKGSSSTPSAPQVVEEAGASAAASAALGLIELSHHVDVLFEREGDLVLAAAVQKDPSLTKLKSIESSE